MQTMTNSFLKFIDLHTLDKWYVSFYLNPNNLKSSYKFIKLKELIKPIKEKIKLADYKGDLRVVKKISFNDGKIHIREENETKMDLYTLYPKDLLVSKINFHQGALALNNYDKIVCTTHYQPYSIDRELVIDEYLILALRNSKFQKHLDFLRADGIKNEATSEFIGELEIPLPSLSEQKSILDKYNQKINESIKSFRRINEIECEIVKYFQSVLGIDEKKNFELKKGLNLIEFTNLSKWSLNHINKDAYDFESAKFKTERVKNLLTFFEGGKTPSKTRSDFWDGDIYWTSPKDFNGRISIEKAEDKITKLAVKEAGMKVYPKGIFLSVFRSGILQHSFPTAITEIETAINQDLKAYSLKEDLIDKYYYLYFVHTFKKYILSLASKKSVTVESINTEDFFEIPIPLPPKHIQNEIALNISNLINKIEKLKLYAFDLKKEAENQFEKAIFS